jgi:hypothetical protein
MDPLAAKLRRHQVESARWYILVALDAGRPLPVDETILYRTLDDSHFKFSPGELRRELDYLATRQLLVITEEDGAWLAKLTRLGIDLVEYTIECDPGIARPAQK